MELRDYLRALRRDWLLILAAVALAAIVTGVVSGPDEPTYQASTVLFVSYDPGSGDPDVTTQRLHSYVALLREQATASAVAEDVGQGLTTEEVQEKLEAEVEPGTVLIVLSATDASPARARAIADSAGRHLAVKARELESTQPRPGASPVNVTVAQAAVTTRAAGGLLRNLAFAAILGLLVGVAASAARQALFGVVRDDGDVRRFGGLDTVGVISTRSEAGGAPTRSAYHADAVLVEAFRKLRAALPAHIGAARTAAEPFSLLLTSAVRGEGTTAVACGLAIALAETGARVALVDANLREPGVAANLAMNTTRGLSDVLTGNATVPEVQREWGTDRLKVVAAGPPVVSPGELVASRAMAETIRALERSFDIVIIDAPPVLPVADAVVLGALTSGVLVVVRVGNTRVERLARAVNLLRGVGGQLVGAVLNALPKKRRGAGIWHRPVGWRRPAPRTVLPARPLSEVPPGDSNVILAIGTVRGRAQAVPPPTPQEPDDIVETDYDGGQKPGG